MLKEIFLPECCIRSQSGILIGASNDDDTVLYVVAVVHFPVTPKSLNAYLSKYEKLHDTVKLRPLGTWISNESKEKHEFEHILPKLFGQKTWISIKMSKNSDDETVFTAEDLEIQNISASSILLTNQYVKTNADVMAVIYNQKDIWDGELCSDSFLNVHNSNGSIENLFVLISACKNGILSYEYGINSNDGVHVTHCCMQRELSIIIYLLTIFITVLLGSIHLPLYYFKKIYSGIYKSNTCIQRIWQSITELSSLLSHAERRFSQFEESIMHLFGSRKKVFDSHNKYEDKDILSTIFVDMIFGVGLLGSLYYFDFLPSTRTTKQAFLPYVESIANQVEELIEWLMGFPAGLKLNHPLNQFLGHFFLYHVRLWLEYSKMMMEFIPYLITYCLMTSCLGLSFLLSIIADAVSTLSFHVYCFYVYAGRLYGLQVAGLMSLWRLFRGKKWNPLRKRVDSLEESGQRADQLFAGTLLFTVLLFLLPTTALYYGIFMLLRVAVLAIQVAISGVVFIISDFPWYSMFVRIFQPQKFIKSMKCSTLLRNGDKLKYKADQVMIVRMGIQPQPISTVITTALSGKRLPSEKFPGFRSFLGKLIFGELIRWT
ncbi:phosphatidylinositol N-acetylglucosaminyltransferase subunit Q-like [Styela clava]